MRPPDRLATLGADASQRPSSSRARELERLPEQDLDKLLAFLRSLKDTQAENALPKLAAESALAKDFPFSDLSQTKRRPALVLASLAGDDAILCRNVPLGFLGRQHQHPPHTTLPYHANRRRYGC